MANIYVVDTDVLSFILKRDTRASRYLPYVTGTIVVISFMTVAELERWTIERNWGAARQAELERFLASLVIRPVDRARCTAWARVMAEARQQGTPIAHADAWIAATARLEGLPLVTHNIRHYRNISNPSLITT